MADKNFNAKLMSALRMMENPVKDTRGHNYKYAQLDQVMDVVKPALFDNGLAMKQGTKIEDGSLVLETTVFDESEVRVMDMRTIERMADPQKQGSYETYMRRYALLTVFGLAPEDDDGQAARQPQRTSRQSKGGDDRKEAVTRLYAALGAYADKSGADIESLKRGIRKRPDFEDTAEFYARVASEFEAA